MGEVFTGQHVELGRELALKLLQVERVANPEAVERFREEARIGGPPPTSAPSATPSSTSSAPADSGGWPHNGINYPRLPSFPV